MEKCKQFFLDGMLTWKVQSDFYIFLNQLNFALTVNEFHLFCWKPKQVICFERLYLGKDLIVVLPTGFGKS